MTGMHGKYALRGKMPLHVEDEYANTDVVYTVLSFATPIAWVKANGSVVVPDVRYSVTTSKQQGYVRAWLGRKGSVEEFDYPSSIVRIIDRDKTEVPL